MVPMLMVTILMTPMLMAPMLMARKRVLLLSNTEDSTPAVEHRRESTCFQIRKRVILLSNKEVILLQVGVLLPLNRIIESC